MSIRIEDLSHLYMPGTPFEKAALRNITLDIDTGICTAIAGHTGSGKTTLIQHLNGLLKPTAGSISVNGVDAAAGNLKELRRQVGMVFQYPEQQLFEETVYKEIAFGLSGNGMSRAEKEMRVREALEAVGLGEGLLDNSPFALSGGQKRRVAIAGVLAMRPEILVLDEPAAGLDPQGRRDILDIMAKLRRERGMTLILVSHNMEDIVRLADRVIILKNGSIAMEGKTREVFRDVTALENTGLAAPQITYFMMKLKTQMPELNDCILTVEEARDELKRVWERNQGRKGRYVERAGHGPVSAWQNDYSQIGPEDQNNSDNLLYGGCLSC